MPRAYAVSIKKPVTYKEINDVNNLVLKDPIYGSEARLIEDCLRKYPLNVDKEIVAMKICLIDTTNTTHLSQHKEKINVSKLADIIVGITDFDKRVENGDPELVEKLSKANDKINLFSFASKYCCYHNVCVYGKDDYSIYDGVVSKHLYKYIGGINKTTPNIMRIYHNYCEFNNWITKYLDLNEITDSKRKRKFDRFIWYKHKDDK